MSDRGAAGRALEALKAPLRGPRDRIRAAMDFLDRRTMSEEAFAAFLERAGVTAGATVMVHSSMKALRRRVPSLTPQTAIALFQRLLGPYGTLLLPTFPFMGKEIDYVATHDSYDPRLTPSGVGVLTEVFRGSPGVVRSLHPTHSVAAWGRRAEEMVASHHLGTAFGPDSPFCKMRDHGGLVIGLGVGMCRAFTFIHTIEELHPRTRALLFSAEPYSMTVTNGGEEFTYSSYPLSVGVRRNLVPLERGMIEKGALANYRKAGLLLAVARVGPFIDLGLDMIERNIYIPS